MAASADVVDGDGHRVPIGSTGRRATSHRADARGWSDPGQADASLRVIYGLILFSKSAGLRCTRKRSSANLAIKIVRPPPMPSGARQRALAGTVRANPQPRHPTTRWALFVDSAGTSDANDRPAEASAFSRMDAVGESDQPTTDRSSRPYWISQDHEPSHVLHLGLGNSW